jgi:hypothetical protein
LCVTVCLGDTFLNTSLTFLHRTALIKLLIDSTSMDHVCFS